MLEKCSPRTLFAFWLHVGGLECWKSATLTHLLRFWPHVGGLDAGKVQPSHTFGVFGILGTTKRMSRKRCQQPRHRSPFGLMLEAWNAAEV